MVLPKSQASESAKHNSSEKKCTPFFFNPKYVGVEIDSQRDSIVLPTSTEMKPESRFLVTP